MMFTKKPDLPVLLGHELLAHRGYLDVDVVLWQIEVGSEVPGWLTGIVPLEGERMRFVQPVDTVEVQQSRELSLAVVSELSQLCL